MTDEWHSRGYLPYWERGESPQFITFRLAESLPTELLARWDQELQALPDGKQLLERRRRVQVALDQGEGAKWLEHPEIGNLVERALLHFDGDRYRLHAWVIMPNHVHALITLVRGRTLSNVMHSWKSFTAKRANELLKRSGAFWAPEYFDRVIRDEGHYDNAIGYAAMNPVKAGLCMLPDDWRFSSAWSGRKSGQDVRAPGN
jgi:REP element-mobilizing transposase RayT